MIPPEEVSFTGPEVQGSIDFVLRGGVLDVAVHAELADAGASQEASGASLHVPITTRQQALAIAAAFAALKTPFGVLPFGTDRFAMARLLPERGAP